MASEFLRAVEEGKNDSTTIFPALTVDGYTWCGSNHDEKRYRHENGNELVKVFGKSHVEEIDGERVLKAPTIITIKDDLVPIYDALQWRSSSRFHPTVTMINAINTIGMAIVIFLSLLAVSILYIQIDNVLTKIFSSVGLSIGGTVVVLVLFFSLKWLYQEVRGIARVLTHVFKARSMHSKQEIRDLFIALIQAVDTDKAHAARIMNRLY